MDIKLVEYNHPLLRKKIPEFDFSNPPVDPKELAGALVDLVSQKRAYGLSANQCGLPYRVFVINIQPGYVCFNPVITAFGMEDSTLLEGCLSFPLLNLTVKRPSAIRVKYYNERGELIVNSLQGIEARVFLHEYDHLEGKSFTQRVSKLVVKRGVDKMHKMNKQFKSNLKMFTEADLKVNNLI